MRHVYQDRTIGGADILNSLADVNINNPEDGQMLVYDASTQRWRNVTQKSLNDLAEVTDLTNIIATGTTNATGGTITKGKFFYLNDDLCQAKADIASGATFTLNTNYEEVTAGGLNALNSNFSDKIKVVTVTLANGWSNLASFPTGYDISNCTILSVVVDENGDGTAWRAGEGSAATGQRLFAEIYSLGVHAYNTFGSYVGRTARIVLMKL